VFHLSVRELSSGALIHNQASEQMEVKRGMPGPAATAQSWSIHAILHGPLIMMLNHEECPTGYIPEWIETARTWFNLPSDYPRDSAIFLNARNGRMVGALRFPGALLIAKHLPEKEILFMSFRSDNEVSLLEFDSHLRKPWLSIVGWSLLAFAAMAAFMEIVRIAWRLSLRLFRRNETERPRD
jgi:hypothetical protein